MTKSLLCILPHIFQTVTLTLIDQVKVLNLTIHEMDTVEGNFYIYVCYELILYVIQHYIQHVKKYAYVLLMSYI